MRITVTVPDEVGEEVKARTDNVSAFTTEALVAKLAAEKRRAARKRLRKIAGHFETESEIIENLHRERRASDRT
jgi:post-segregation antitoxin (ccd killing protein)